MKVCLADQIAPFVDDAFRITPSQLGGIDVLTMAFGFGFQIYFDFAGYSMIAIGSARLIGVGFPNNFNWPYLATSPREFWRRWHITLSSWIRDYLYLPLSDLQQRGHSGGGIDIQFASSNRRGLRAATALFLTWFIMGLWHGASWNFALWGLWHATFIFLYRQIHPHLPSNGGLVFSVLGWVATLSIAMLGWIFFRAQSVEGAFGLYARLFDVGSYRNLAFRENYYLVVFAITISMLLLRMLSSRPFPLLRTRVVSYVGEVFSVSFALFFVYVFLRPVNQFIYFQF